MTPYFFILIVWKKGSVYMFAIGNITSKLYVGKRFVTSPPAKAIEGVLKSHIMIGKKGLSTQSEALKNYFLGMAEISKNPNIKHFCKSFYV